MSCDDSGSVLTDIHHLQKHAKTWCPLKLNTDGNENEPERRIAGRLMMEEDDDVIEVISMYDDMDEASGNEDKNEYPMTMLAAIQR